MNEEDIHDKTVSDMVRSFEEDDKEMIKIRKTQKTSYIIDGGPEYNPKPSKNYFCKKTFWQKLKGVYYAVKLLFVEPEEFTIDSGDSQSYQKDISKELKRLAPEGSFSIHIRKNDQKYYSEYATAEDCQYDFYLTNEDDLAAIYKGKVLIRKGKVFYYDRYPIGGGPFKLDDFSDPTFKELSKAIALDIEGLVA